MKYIIAGNHNQYLNYIKKHNSTITTYISEYENLMELRDEKILCIGI